MWQTQAACARSNPDLFFSDETVLEAKAVCDGCSVIEDCLQYALTTSQEGVWGGTTSDDRHRIRRRNWSSTGGTIAVGEGKATISLGSK
jgi:WhiB family transcriptional regulator, redox-sensing transcriptional regulator